MIFTDMNHIYVIKCVVRLRGQRSRLVKIMFVHFLTSLWMAEIENNTAKMLTLMRVSRIRNNMYTCYSKAKTCQDKYVCSDSYLEIMRNSVAIKYARGIRSSTLYLNV